MMKYGLLPLTLCFLSSFGSSAHAYSATDTSDEAVSSASTDTENAAATANVATSYDSDYNYHNKATPSVAYGTPENDARPGVYYFELGANAFAHKDYAHAVSMYKVAASWAEKTAEYNLAVMYARGQGVAVDLPRAMAWSALAAERGDTRYAETREAIYASLSKEQFDQANAIWRELKKTYGDEVALRRAKARWADVRNNVTGSHVGSIGNLSVGGTSDMEHAPVPRDSSGKSLRMSTTGYELSGGNQEDGSIAYRQLRESDNPYDLKFVRLPLGTATVSPPVPVAGGDNTKSPKSDTLDQNKHYR
jgi:TPR repeat protein